MIDIILLLATIQNMTAPEAFAFTNYYVDANSEWKYFKYSQPIQTFLKTGVGDCTDRANLKCYVLKKDGIKCQTVHGYREGIKHDWVQAQINNTWVASETTPIKGMGIW